MASVKKMHPEREKKKHISRTRVDKSHNIFLGGRELLVGKFTKILVSFYITESIQFFILSEEDFPLGAICVKFLSVVFKLMFK